MNELFFIVEEAQEGGYQARALEHPVFTEAESIEKLKEAIREAVNCHFDTDKPKLIRLHFVREEVFAA